MKLKKLNLWRSGHQSEDHVTNYARRLFQESPRWFVSYCNPPSGSWKELMLRRGDEVYLQEIHKRGVGKMKRPDLVAQYIGGRDDTTNLLLFESKQTRSKWDSELPDLMENFFEGVEDYDESSGIREIPFWHKRDIGTNSWDITPESERVWFANTPVNYSYGFGFISENGPDADREWMKLALKSQDQPRPPIILISIYWGTAGSTPQALAVCSDTFPGQLVDSIQLSNLEVTKL